MPLGACRGVCHLDTPEVGSSATAVTLPHGCPNPWSSQNAAKAAGSPSNISVRVTGWSIVHAVAQSSAAAAVRNPVTYRPASRSGGAPPHAPSSMARSAGITADRRRSHRRSVPWPRGLSTQRGRLAVRCPAGWTVSAGSGRESGTCPTGSTLSALPPDPSPDVGLTRPKPKASRLRSDQSDICPPLGHRGAVLTLGTLDLRVPDASGPGRSPRSVAIPDIRPEAQRGDHARQGRTGGSRSLAEGLRLIAEPRCPISASTRSRTVAL